MRQACNQLFPTGANSELLTGVSFPSQSFVDFVLPDLSKDLEKGMYITMKLAALHNDPIVAAMYTTAQDFFARLDQELIAARNGDRMALGRAYNMAAFPEAREIGFGYSRSGWAGRGVGRGVLSHRIVTELYDHPGIASLCAIEPDVITFIHGVGLDRSSDAWATICKTHLIDYTQAQAHALAFNASCMQTVRVPRVWDAKLGRLSSRSAELPVHRGRPILLVPKSIVRSSPPVRVEHYRNAFGIHADDEATKAIIMEENRENADRLRRAMEAVLKDEKRFRPRREFRDDG